MDFIFVVRRLIARLVRTRGNDPIGGFPQRSHSGVGRLRRLSLFIAVIDQNSLATRIVAGIDVAPAIADNKTAREIEIVLTLGLKQQARIGLAASAVIN